VTKVQWVQRYGEMSGRTEPGWVRQMAGLRPWLRSGASIGWWYAIQWTAESLWYLNSEGAAGNARLATWTRTRLLFSGIHASSSSPVLNWFLFNRDFTGKSTLLKAVECPRERRYQCSTSWELLWPASISGGQAGIPFVQVSAGYSQASQSNSHSLPSPACHHNARRSYPPTDGAECVWPAKHAWRHSEGCTRPAVFEKGTDTGQLLVEGVTSRRDFGFSSA